VYAIGGRPLDPARNFDLVDRYDLSSGQWESRRSLGTARSGHGAAVLDGRIHALGGETGVAVLDSHEAYDPELDVWVALAPPPTPRHGLGVAVLSGRLYAIGGGPVAGLGQTTVVEVFSP
jgi:hypothetical protein